MLYNDEAKLNVTNGQQRNHCQMMNQMNEKMCPKKRMNLNQRKTALSIACCCSMINLGAF